MPYDVMLFVVGAGEVNKARHQQLCQKIMSLSVEHNIPVSNYTVMLSYETDKAAMDQLQVCGRHVA